MSFGKALKYGNFISRVNPGRKGTSDFTGDMPERYNIGPNLEKRVLGSALGLHRTSVLSMLRDVDSSTNPSICENKDTKDLKDLAATILATAQLLASLNAKEPAREKKVLLSAAMVPQCLEAFRLLFPAQLYIVHVAPIHSCLALNFTILLTPSNVLISTSEGSFSIHMAAETISTSAPAQPFPPAGAQVLAAPPAAALGTGPVMLSRSAIIRLMRPLMEAVDRMFGELSLQAERGLLEVDIMAPVSTTVIAPAPAAVAHFNTYYSIQSMNAARIHALLRAEFIMASLSSNIIQVGGQAGALSLVPLQLGAPAHCKLLATFTGFCIGPFLAAMSHLTSVTDSKSSRAGADPFKLYPDIWLSEVLPWLILPILMKPATHMGAGCPPANSGLVIDLAVYAGVLPVCMVPLPAPGRLIAGHDHVLLAPHAPPSHVDQGGMLHLVLQRLKGLAQHALSTYQNVLAAVPALPGHPNHTGMLLALLDCLRGILEPLMIASQDIMSILSAIQDGKAPTQQGLPDTIAVVFDTLHVHIPLLRPVAALLNNACLKFDALPVYTVNGVRSLTVGLHQLESLPTGVMTRLANAISTAILGLVPWGSSALPTAGGPDAGHPHIMGSINHQIVVPPQHLMPLPQPDQAATSQAGQQEHGLPAQDGHIEQRNAPGAEGGLLASMPSTYIGRLYWAAGAVTGTVQGTANGLYSAATENVQGAAEGLYKLLKRTPAAAAVAAV